MRFLKPGGLMITVVPNFSGFMGSIQKLIDVDVLNKHVVLNREQVASAHEGAGLSVISCDYFLVLHLGVINLEWLKERGTLGWIGFKILERLSFDMSRIIWFLENFFPWLKPNDFSSPYITCVCVKKPQK